MSVSAVADIYVNNDEASPENYFKKLDKKKQNIEIFNTPNGNARPRSAIRFKKVVFSTNKTRITPSNLRLREKQESTTKKVYELEIENFSLKENLKKTKRLLEAALGKLSKSCLGEDVFDEYLRQGLYIQYLEKELEKYRLVFESSHEMTKNKLLISKMSEKIKQLQNDKKGLNEELVKSKRGTFFVSSKTSQNDVVRVVSKIYRACCKIRLGIDELGYVINPNTLDSLSISHILKGLQAINLILSQSEIQSLISIIIGYEVEEISQDKLIQGIKFYNKDCLEYESIRKDIETLRLAFASSSITQSQLLSEYKTRVFTSSSFIQELFKSGLTIDSSILSKTFHSFYDPSEEISSSEAIQLFFSLFENKFLSKEEEQLLDLEVRKVFKVKWSEFIESAQETDYKAQSELNYSEFYTILNKLEINLSEDSKEYLKVFFYSKTGKPDRVPYVNFYLNFK